VTSEHRFLTVAVARVCRDAEALQAAMRETVAEQDLLVTQLQEQLSAQQAVSMAAPQPAARAAARTELDPFREGAPAQQACSQPGDGSMSPAAEAAAGPEASGQRSKQAAAAQEAPPSEQLQQRQRTGSVSAQQAHHLSERLEQLQQEVAAAILAAAPAVPTAQSDIFGITDAVCQLVARIQVIRRCSIVSGSFVRSCKRKPDAVCIKSGAEPANVFASEIRARKSIVLLRSGIGGASRGAAGGCRRSTAAAAAVATGGSSGARGGAGRGSSGGVLDRHLDGTAHPGPERAQRTAAGSRPGAAGGAAPAAGEGLGIKTIQG